MSDPLWINAASGAPEHNARELRRAFAALLYPHATDRFGAREGVRPGGVDAVTLSGTTWTVHHLNAVVYPGLTDLSGPYVVQHPEESGSLNPADGSNDRIDALDLQVEDHDEDVSGQRRARAVYVAGTPSTTPVEPALTATSFRLATFLVPAGGSPSPTITYVAPFAVASGGVMPVRDDTELPGNTSGLYDGAPRWNRETASLDVHDGASTWRTVGSAGGYQPGGQPEIFTSDGTFSKANFPGLRAVRVKLVGGGGGSGGVASTGTGEASEAAGGGGGGYAELFLEASQLASSETITVGAGGSGGAAGANSGGSGESSSFGVHVTVGGGGGGGGDTAHGGNGTKIAGSGGSGGSGGYLHIDGSDGGHGLIHQGEANLNNYGGSSHLAGLQIAGGFSAAGQPGRNYGGGAAGPRNNDSEASQSGANGAAGIVIVELLY